MVVPSRRFCSRDAIVATFVNYPTKQHRGVSLVVVAHTKLRMIAPCGSRNQGNRKLHTCFTASLSFFVVSTWLVAELETFLSPSLANCVLSGVTAFDSAACDLTWGAF
jgi:hypothetical protein